MRVKGNRYYREKYPLSILQNKVHKAAMKKTADYFREKKGQKITHKQIEMVLKSIHIYLKHVVNNLHKTGGKNDPSVVHLHIGYGRTLYLKVLSDMHKNGQFTDQEFKVIQNEIYPEEFKIYNNLIKNRQQWLKKNNLLENPTCPQTEKCAPSPKSLWDLEMF